MVCACVCRPDIIHCHDWPTAPVCYGDKGPSKSVFTIHNLNFGADLIGRAMQAAQVTVARFVIIRIVIFLDVPANGYVPPRRALT